MSIRFNRAAAVATAATVVFALTGMAGSGAIAQDQPIRATAAAPQGNAGSTDPQADQIRFTATEVVQPLSQPSPAMATMPAASVRSLRALVDAMPEDPALSRDLTCLATAIYYEARGETLDGQLAVGEVVVNRAGSGRFPQDYCGVVTQPGQFSFVTRGAMPQANRSGPAWQRASAIARIAHQDLWDSQAQDALFFHASRVRPSWAQRHQALARIDNHVFYR